MLNAARFPKHTFTGQAYSSKRLFTSIVCILSSKMTALVSTKERTIYVCVSVVRVCLHAANLMSVASVPMCASASPVLHCFKIPYILRLLQRDPAQTDCITQSAQRLS